MTGPLQHFKLLVPCLQDMVFLAHAHSLCLRDPARCGTSQLPFQPPIRARLTLALGQHGTVQHGSKVLVGRRARAAVLDQVWQHMLLRRRACACKKYTDIKGRHVVQGRSVQPMRPDQQLYSTHDSRPISMIACMRDTHQTFFIHAPPIGEQVG